MAELIERDLTIHSLSQHLSQGLYKGTDYMNDEIKWCCRVDISPVEAYARGFEYGIRLAQTIVSNRPTTTESKIRASVIDEFAELLKKAAIRGAFEYKPDKKAPWRKELVYCKVVGTRKIDEIAEQLKEE